MFKSLRKLVFLTKEQKIYMAKIKELNAFDYSYYRSYFKKRSSKHLFPLQHFIVTGENDGLKPNKDFNPRFYSLKYDDVDSSGLAPFNHYLTSGRADGRTSDLDGDVFINVPAVESDVSHLKMPTIPEWKAKSSNIIVLHIYYKDLWAEFQKLFESINDDFDLVCSVTDNGDSDQAYDDLVQEIKSFKDDAQVIKFPNHGRDIYPFVELINSKVLSQYDVICKLHTKKSPHRGDGVEWRNILTKSIIADKSKPHLFKLFSKQSSVGVVVGDGNLALSRIDLWGPNMKRAYDLLCNRAGFKVDLANLCFPMGSMFLCKGFMLDGVGSMFLKASDFELEAGQLDGTTAHALERIFGYIAKEYNFDMMETSAFISKNSE